MTVAPVRPRDKIDAECRTARLSGRASGVPFASDARTHRRRRGERRHERRLIALVKTADCRIGEGVRISPAMPSNTVDIRARQSRSRARRAGGFDAASLHADGRDRAQPADRPARWRRSWRMSVGYANERVAFERKIGKFQAVQQNLARLAGETAAALAAAGSAADTIAQSRHRRRRGVPRSRVRENPRRRSRRRRLGHRASGAWRHRLHQRARAASLHAAAAVVARRFRQRELLGGDARRA